MPHERKRQVDELISRLLGFSPIIGLFGHRQVGKTTLSEKLSDDYFTLDDRDTLRTARDDPARFVGRRKRGVTMVIDECQLVPELFPALKERVRRSKEPGQYVLTGSVRFTSAKATRESLAGRISPLEMFPLLLSELEGKPLPDAVPTLLAVPRFSESSLGHLKTGSELRGTQSALEKYLRRGGLPGLCFIREERLRREHLASLHSLILDRDLRLVVETRLSLDMLRRWLQWIAANGWNEYSATRARSATGISFYSQRNLLYALESIYLVRRISITGRSGEIVLLEDQYEEWALSQGRLTPEEQLLSCFYRNVRGQFLYRLGEPVQYESYWTRAGARVPLVLRGERASLGFIPLAGEVPTLAQRRAADSFLRNDPEGKVIYLMPVADVPSIEEPRILRCSAAALI